MRLLIDRRRVNVPRSMLERMVCVVSNGSWSKRPSEAVASLMEEVTGDLEDFWSRGQPYWRSSMSIVRSHKSPRE